MERYVLTRDRIYRRESFGGILFSQTSKETRFYNHAAALVIESFLAPRLLADEAFAARLLADGALEPARASATGRAFFTDCFDFADDRVRTPLGVELELTLRCMRSCRYCAYESRPDVDTSRDLSRATYRALFEKLAQAGVLYLRFTGGDPLTRADGLDIVADADAHHFGLAIASDLTVFEPWHAERLAQLWNLVCLQTTLDGPTPAIADRLRGSGNFRRVTSALDVLAAHGVPVVVGTILTRHNVGAIYETGKLLSRWPVAWCVSPLYAAGRGRDCEAAIPDDADLAAAQAQFARAIDEGLVRPADPAWRVLAARQDGARPPGLWDAQPWLVRSPDRVLRVDPAGRGYTSIHLKEVLHDNVYIGSVLDTDLVTLWNDSPLLRELRHRRVRNPYFGEVFDIRTLTQRSQEGART
jgi:MoaA/NifB/PqqE/SkfB family radical SAM enzyme